MKTERVRGLGRKNKRGDRKEESNDSPEIPDRRETSDIPGLPSGVEKPGDSGHNTWPSQAIEAR